MDSLARRFAFIPVLALGLMLGACSDDESTGLDDDIDSEATTVSLYLTDAPGDVSRVWVEITEVNLVGGGAPPVVILDEPTGLIELTELVDRTQALVVDEAIEPGDYNVMRLVIGDAVLETDDGDVYTTSGAEHPEGTEATGSLLCPSCSNSGLKILLAGTLSFEEGEDAGVLLDFDVSQSFGRQAGQSGMWVMNPVIHGTKGDDDEFESGDDSRTEINGEVLLAEGVQIPECPAGEARTLEDFVPLASAATLTDDEGNALVFSGEAEEDGTFEIKVGPPDTYEFGFIESTELDEGGPLTFEATVAPASLEIVEGDEEVGGVTYTITGVSCEGEDDSGESAPALVSVYLTDAPGDVSRVWLDISEITLIGGGPPETVLEESTGLIEVTELVDQAMQIVEDTEIEPDDYAQVRLKLGGAVLETDGGAVYAFGGAEHPEGAEITGELTCPGCAQSGLKVNLAGDTELEVGEDAGILLDFDVAQSFGRAAGNSGRWVMRPVIHANKGNDGEMEDDDGGRIHAHGW